jgi:hypothetical protein
MNFDSPLLAERGLPRGRPVSASLRNVSCVTATAVSPSENWDVSLRRRNFRPSLNLRSPWLGLAEILGSFSTKE